MSRIAIASGVVVEQLGADLMVMIPGSTGVLTLSGDAATAVRRIQSGSPVATDAVVSDLVRLGVLETSGLSRRGLIRAGAIGAGAGIAVMAMPSVAMASSEQSIDGGSGRFRLYYNDGPTPLERWYAFEWTTPLLAEQPEDPSNLEIDTDETYTSVEFYMGEVYGPGMFDPPTGEWMFSWVIKDFDLVESGSYSGTFDWDGNSYEVNFTWDSTW